MCKPKVEGGLGFGVWEDFFKESCYFREVAMEVFYLVLHLISLLTWAYMLNGRKMS